VREISAAYDNGGAHQTDLLSHEIAERVWADYPQGISHGKEWVFILSRSALSDEERKREFYARVKFLRPVLDSLTARGFLHQDPTGTVPGRVRHVTGAVSISNTYWPTDLVTQIGALEEEESE